MTKFIFIRHGKKLFDNGKPIDGKPAHDPPLLKDQEDELEKKITDLTSKYGEPDSIISSPFLRTRQTSTIISNFLKYKSVKYEIRVKEFLGWQKPAGSPAILDDITKAYMGGDLLGMEQPINVENRVEDFINEFESDDTKDKIYYVVTHGIVISKACKIKGRNKSHFDNFCGAYIDGDIVEFF
tara:strand:+ start:56 stop:604 length:549 start_codon:yes stop_codon:yes gene_type:complete